MTMSRSPISSDPLDGAERPVPRWMNATDLAAVAREELAPDAYEYVASSAGDGSTLAANIAAFDRYRFVPRVLQEVSTVDTNLDAFGLHLDAPLFVSPMGWQRLVRPDGEMATALGAAQARLPFTLSTNGTTSIEELATVDGLQGWFQLYFVTPDRGVLADLVHRAESSGYTAICVTIDNPVQGFRRDAIQRGGSTRAGREALTAPNLEPYGDRVAASSGHAGSDFAPRTHYPATWADLAWLRQQTSLPLIVKGVLNPYDARRAVDAGAQAILISNHGGRQLDRCVATLDVLPAVRTAVGGKAAVFVDGGIRSATDAAIALCLGAQAVGLGRPVLWALSYGGAAGVASFLGTLRTELIRVLQLLGSAELGDLSPLLLFDQATGRQGQYSTAEWLVQDDAAR